MLDVDRDVSEGEDVAETLEEAESLKLPELLALPDGEIDILELTDVEDDELRDPLILDEDVTLIL